jgi:hypothetical protein|tara:strand:- start:39 stop:866 length:828 start_codon:yes stop_codon:yes gene_type:complete
MEELLQKARALYPGLPDSFINLYVQYWEQTGDPQQAISKTRQDPAYDTIFPGNKTDRGQIRYDEVTYFALEDSYIGTLAEYGVPRATSINLLQDRFVSLLENEVSANEFQQRVAAVYRGVQENIPQVKTFYADNFGIDLDEQSIFLGALDPSVGEDIVAGKITTAQIGGEAARAGFTISLEEARRIQQFGLSQAEARRLFTQAQTQIPQIQELQEREGRTTDEVFDLDDFTEAVVFQGPEELEEIRRLQRSEESRFSPVGGPARRGGRVTGLTEQ